MSAYDEDVVEALVSIQEAGTTATISRKNNDGVFDPIVGRETTPATYSTGSISCVVLPLSERTLRQLASGRVHADNFQEMSIQGRLRKLLIAASGAPFEPVAGDTVTGIEGFTWKVLGCNPLHPDGVTAIIYTVAISRK